MTTLLSEGQLRQQLRVRPAQGRPPLLVGGLQDAAGIGRPCIVCRRAAMSPDAQHEVSSTGGILITHEACYLLWREESVSSQAPRQPR
jgi:hypothetical protein